MTEGSLEQALDYAPTGIALLTGDGCIRWANRRLGRMLRRNADDLVGVPLASAHRRRRRHRRPRSPPTASTSARCATTAACASSDPTERRCWGGVALSRLPDERLGSRAGRPGQRPLRARCGPRSSSAWSCRVSTTASSRSTPRAGREREPGRVAPARHRRSTSSLGEVTRSPDWDDARRGTANRSHPTDRPEAVVARTGEPGAGIARRPRRRRARSAGSRSRPTRSSAPNGERWVVASYSDVSERRRVEAELRVSMAADRAKSEFLSRMSHELRTPLNVVLGFAQLLQMDDLAPQHRESVDQILTAGRHLLGLVDEVLDLERIERGRLEVELDAGPRGPAPAGGGRARAAARRRERHHRRDVRLGTDDGIVRDRRRARAAPGAAQPAHERDQVQPTGRPRHGRGAEIADTIVVRVRDTGRGIAPDQLAQIFLPFERLDADALGIDGAGVGLALSKRLTEAMGGAIGVESTLGVGSTFWFVVRATRVDSAAAPGEPDGRAAERRGRSPSSRARPTGPRGACSTSRTTRRAGRCSSSSSPAGAASSSSPSAPSPTGSGSRVRDRTRRDPPRPPPARRLGRGRACATLRADPRTAGTPVIVLTADATPPGGEALLGLGADGLPHEAGRRRRALRHPRGSGTRRELTASRPAPVAAPAQAASVEPTVGTGRHGTDGRRPRGRATSGRMLVVDDDDPSRVADPPVPRARGLRRSSEAADGPAALQAVTAEPPDVVVLDLGLPGPRRPRRAPQHPTGQRRAGDRAHRARRGGRQARRASTPAPTTTS